MFNLSFDAGKSAHFDLNADQVSTLVNNHEVLGHILAIGLSNIIKDSYASITREDFANDDEWRKAQNEQAQLKFGALMAGDIRTRTTARKPKLSDEDAFRRNFMVAELKKAFIAKHSRELWKEKTEGESGAAFITGLLEKHGERFADSAAEAWKAELAKRAKTKELAASIEFDI